MVNLPDIRPSGNMESRIPDIRYDIQFPAGYQTLIPDIRSIDPYFIPLSVAMTLQVLGRLPLGQNRGYHWEAGFGTGYTLSVIF